MKQLIIITIIAVCVAFVAACVSTASVEEQADTYEGEAQGFRGPIRVLVHIGESGIQDIEVLESAEDEFVGGLAIQSLLEAVLDTNSTDVDAVSGATESSAGFLEAVKNALTSISKDY
jgi:fumarate reductase flavoprotein subunit